MRRWVVKGVIRQSTGRAYASGKGTAEVLGSGAAEDVDKKIRRELEGMQPRGHRLWRGRDGVEEDRKVAQKLLARVRELKEKRGVAVGPMACGAVLQHCAKHGIDDVALETREWMSVVNIPSWEHSLQHDAWTLRALSTRYRTTRHRPGKRADVAKHISRLWESVKWYHDFSTGDAEILSTMATQLFGCDREEDAMALVRILRHRKANLTKCLWTSLLRRAPSMAAVESVFEAMKRQGIRPDCACYDVLLGRCKAHRDADAAARFFDEAVMHGFVLKDPMMWTHYIRALLACGRLGAALHAFQHAPPQSQAYAAVLEALAAHRQGSSAVNPAYGRLGDSLVSDAAARGWKTHALERAWDHSPQPGAEDASH